ncbi:TPA: hypothetical protein ACKTGI_003480 [Pseudomonas aeruginosa]
MKLLKTIFSTALLITSFSSLAAQIIKDEDFLAINPEIEAKEISGTYNLSFEGKNNIGHIDQYGVQLGYPFQIYKIEKNGSETDLYLNESGTTLTKANADDSCKIKVQREYNGYCFHILKIVAKSNNQFEFIDKGRSLVATKTQ